MITIIITRESEVAKLRALGVKDREPPQWHYDRTGSPFTQREYGHQYKTRTSGRKKAV